MGHWEADLVICRRSRPVLALHERKTRITLMARLAARAPLLAIIDEVIKPAYAVLETVR